jgi:hypothetical protein
MRRFWLFRSDIKHLEYYHQYKELEEFEAKCHDYYLLMGLWFLKHDYFDEVVIWRVSNNPPAPITFDINGRKFHQFWVYNLEQTTKYPAPDISFFRGGFQIYDTVTSKHPKFFGKKLYLGAGKRIVSQWGGKYDYYLMEDKRDFKKGLKCLPFYKTASDKIFKPLDLKKDFDICWPCNFAQLRHKGQEDFIRAVSQDKFLKSLKIAHCGNRPKVGRKMCEGYRINNIEFFGELERPELNVMLNRSRLGLNNSNRVDGCPRVSTEILMSGTPLLLRDQVRLLPHFTKSKSVIEYSINNIASKIKGALQNYDKHHQAVLEDIQGRLSFDTVTKKNIDLWLSL